MVPADGWSQPVGGPLLQPLFAGRIAVGAGAGGADCDDPGAGGGGARTGVKPGAGGAAGAGAVLGGAGGGGRAWGAAVVVVAAGGGGGGGTALAVPDKPMHVHPTSAATQVDPLTPRIAAGAVRPLPVPPKLDVVLAHFMFIFDSSFLECQLDALKNANAWPWI